MLKLSDIKNKYPWDCYKYSVNEAWERAVKENDKQIVVLDDDPTGAQTMSGVTVYTSWSKRILKKIEQSKEKVTFVWTNPQINKFAKDKTFGYTSSDLKQWITEKHGANLRKRIVSISLQELHSGNNEIAYKKLMNAKDFDKIIVNAMDSYDLKVFATLINKAMEQNKRFIFRTTASFVNAISGVFAKKAVIKSNSRKKGLFVAGSHTELTTKQIRNLIDSSVVGAELDISMVFNKSAKQKELNRLKIEITRLLKCGRSVCIFTPRKYQTFEGKTNLEIAESVSRALVYIAKKVQRHADHIVAKGGITSYEIAVHALKIKKATVVGQLINGVFVITAKNWAGKQINYTIFPGNVGEADSLLHIRQKYEGITKYEAN